MQTEPDLYSPIEPYASHRMAVDGHSVPTRQSVADFSFSKPLGDLS